MQGTGLKNNKIKNLMWTENIKIKVKINMINYKMRNLNIHWNIKKYKKNTNEAEEDKWGIINIIL